MDLGNSSKAVSTQSNYEGRLHIEEVKRPAMEAMERLSLVTTLNPLQKTPFQAHGFS